MNEIDDEVREVLWRKSRDVPPQLEVPHALAARVRRRIALNALAVGATAVLAVSGVVVGLRAFNASPIPKVTTGRDTGCTSAQLHAAGSMEGAAGSREGNIALTNGSDETCALQGTPTIELLDPSGTPITSGVTFDPAPAAWEANGAPTPPGWPTVTLAPGEAASMKIRWSNWCPDGRPAPTWRVEIPGDGAIEIAGMEDVYPPPCNGAGLPSTIEVGPFEPAPGP